MVDQPMMGGFGGFSVTQRKPKKARKTRNEVIKQAADKYNRSLSNAATLLDNLEKTDVFGPVVRAARERLVYLMRKDPTIMAYLKIIAEWKRVIDAPRFAEAELTKLLGPDLAAVEERTQAAP